MFPAMKMIYHIALTQQIQSLTIWCMLLLFGLAALKAALVVLASFFVIINFLSEDSNSHTVFAARRPALFTRLFLGLEVMPLCDRLHLGHLLELICSDPDYIHTGLLQNILKYLKGILFFAIIKA